MLTLTWQVARQVEGGPICLLIRSLSLISGRCLSLRVHWLLCIKVQFVCCNIICGNITGFSMVAKFGAAKVGFLDVSLKPTYLCGAKPRLTTVPLYQCSLRDCDTVKRANLEAYE
jgi:hypothetical protein